MVQVYLIKWILTNSYILSYERLKLQTGNETMFGFSQKNMNIRL